MIAHIEQMERRPMIEPLESRSQNDLKARLIARAWQDADFKRQLLGNPKAAIEQEFGIELPADLEVTAVEETPAHLYLVVPVNRTSLSEERLTTEQWVVGSSCKVCTCVSCTCICTFSSCV